MLAFIEARASIGNEVYVEKATNKAIFTIFGTGSRENVNLNNIIEGAAAGYKIARGSVAATASSAITTGLTTITGYSLNQFADDSTKANVAVAITGDVSGGTLTPYRWKYTGAGDTTLIAATTGGTLYWMAIGT